MNTPRYQDDSATCEHQPTEPTVGPTQEGEELTAMTTQTGEEEISGFVLGYN